MKSMNEIEQSLKQLESAGDPAIHQRILDGLVSEMEKGMVRSASGLRDETFPPALLVVLPTVPQVTAPAGLRGPPPPHDSTGIPIARAQESRMTESRISSVEFGDPRSPCL